MSECAIFFALLALLVGYDIWVTRRYSRQMEALNEDLWRCLARQREEDDL